MGDMAHHDTTTAVLGAGAIGSAVTRSLLAAGHRTVVWNRSPGRLAPLVEAGATAVREPAEALASAPLSILALTDYAAVGELLDRLGDVDLGGRNVVVLGTGSPEEARTAAKRFGALGASYVDGGIQASPETVGSPEASFLLSGAAEAFAEHRATLEALGTLRFVGSEPGAAAAWDLALFGAWYDAQLGLLRALDLARAAGVDLDAFAETLRAQLAHVPPAAEGVVGELRSGSYPAGPAGLAEHLTLLRRLVDARAGARLGDGGLREVTALVESEVAAGRGSEGLTALVGASR